MKVIHYRPTENDTLRLGLLLGAIGKRKGVHYSRIIATGDATLSRVAAANIAPDQPIIVAGRECAPDSLPALKAAAACLKQSLALRRNLYPPRSRVSKAVAEVAAFVKAAKVAS